MKRNDCIIFLLAAILALVFYAAIHTSAAWAGPPFVTDDPETVGLNHWEIDLASVMSKDNAILATAPHLEVNYGLLENMDLHMIAPLVYVRPKGGPSNYGFGDLELGIKFRFVRENKWLPAIGTFPLVEIPTGDHDRGLGNGRAQVFIPIWLEKEWEPWSIFGGGGFWYHPGTDNKNYWIFGCVVERDLSKKISLGTELFYATPRTVGESSRLAFNIGGFFNFSENHHLLFSAGRDIHGPIRFSMYLGYQLTVGPGEEKREGAFSFLFNKFP